MVTTNQGWIFKFNRAPSRCLPRRRACLALSPSDTEQLGRSQDESDDGRVVEQLRQTRVSFPLSGKSFPLSGRTNFLPRNPTPETGLWRQWAEGEQYLEIGERHLLGNFMKIHFFSDVSPRMDFSEEVAARMDFWRGICGEEGCSYGSGLGG